MSPFGFALMHGAFLNVACRCTPLLVHPCFSPTTRLDWTILCYETNPNQQCRCLRTSCYESLRPAIQRQPPSWLSTSIVSVCLNIVVVIVIVVGIISCSINITAINMTAISISITVTSISSIVISISITAISISS